MKLNVEVVLATCTVVLLAVAIHLPPRVEESLLLPGLFIAFKIGNFIYLTTMMFRVITVLVACFVYSILAVLVAQLIVVVRRHNTANSPRLPTASHDAQTLALEHHTGSYPTKKETRP